ncbi:sulfatase [Aquimarina sp. U1-2]|uniref:sulfatase family protein n=1 Tax=Aquimarina sp. U1-2 TaxID=2823141 RepID=UPI001AECA891|nr:sulfatase [Aquimarina sp. U1-2]MBP2830653.1 sulfatase [Aquimarina sp. U1-2]
MNIQVKIDNTIIKKSAKIAIALLLITTFCQCKGEKNERSKDVDSIERPNIIFLLTDDQRWDALSYTGNPDIKTPHIDSLAKKGVYFKNAYVTTSICAVSRASILSGQYARRHQIWGFSKNFTSTQLQNTYPLLLRKAGYITGFIGKYGVGNQLPVAEYDYWKGFGGQGSFNQKDENGDPIHLTQKIGQQAFEFLEQQKNTEKPFCLSISFKAPHVEGDPGYFLPDSAYNNLYKGDTLLIPSTSAEAYLNHFPASFTTNNVARKRWQTRFATPEMQQISIKKYYQLIHGVDVIVGKLVEQLKATGKDQNTVIIYTSDNGFYLGEYGFAGKWYGSDPSIRVPMIIYDPRNPTIGKTIDKKVLNIDIAPTILSMAHVTTPITMQGKDLTKLIENPEIEWRDAFFYEHLWQSSEHYYIPSTEGLVWKDKKYMKYFMNQNTDEIIFEELYDLSKDPNETNNLIDKSEYKPLEKKVKEKYTAVKKAAF